MIDVANPITAKLYGGAGGAAPGEGDAKFGDDDSDDDIDHDEL